MAKLKGWCSSKDWCLIGALLFSGAPLRFALLSLIAHPVCPQLLSSHLAEMPDSFLLKGSRDRKKGKCVGEDSALVLKVVLGEVIIGFHSKTKGERTTAHD